MTEQQTAADNALVEKLVAFDDNWHEATCVEAAERIKSLLAEADELRVQLAQIIMQQDEEWQEAKADRQRMREALERARPYVSSAALQYISVGIDADLRAVDTALNPASEEANDG